MLNTLVNEIQAANTILLSTHRQCDGDGLGSQIALYHALKKMHKKVRILNVDGTPKKYHFLETDRLIQTFEGQHETLEQTDLALIFDTNDSRLLEPLYSELKNKCKQILFIDHHPVLAQGPAPTKGSYINTKAASTGEIAYDLIRDLSIELDVKIARALYTSLVFDTQLFRFIRNSPSSHLMAADLLKYNIHAEDIHLRLFGNYTVQKMEFLAHSLSQIEYFAEGRLAVLRLSNDDLAKFAVAAEESGDVVDLLMNIESLEAAAVLREDGPQKFKLSLRSKGYFDVLSIAESMGGGGHLFSSGAFLKGPYETIKKSVVGGLIAALDNAHLASDPSLNQKKHESA